MEPSIEYGPAFAGVLRALVRAGTPRTLRGRIAVTIQAGRVEPVSFTCFGRDGGDVWPSALFRAELRLWIQDRVPSDWYGSVTVQVDDSESAQVVIGRSFR